MDVTTLRIATGGNDQEYGPVERALARLITAGYEIVPPRHGITRPMVDMLHRIEVGQQTFEQTKRVSALVHRATLNNVDAAVALGLLVREYVILTSGGYYELTVKGRQFCSTPPNQEP